MTEQKNSSEKTEKTDRNEKPASAPKKPSIEPKSARGVSTTARRKTAKEADAAKRIEANAEGDGGFRNAEHAAHRIDVDHDALLFERRLQLLQERLKGT